MHKQSFKISNLISIAKFCEQESQTPNGELFGVTDGKAVGTYIEHKFKNFLLSKYDLQVGSSASGIDLPSPEINTDIKVTSIKQPQRPVRSKMRSKNFSGLVTICWCSCMTNMMMRKQKRNCWILSVVHL
jgi:hypothetical protein